MLSSSQNEKLLQQLILAGREDDMKQKYMLRNHSMEWPYRFSLRPLLLKWSVLIVIFVNSNALSRRTPNFFHTMNLLTARVLSIREILALHMFQKGAK